MDAALRLHHIRKTFGRTTAVDDLTWNDFKTFTDFYNDFLTAAQDAVKKGTAVDDFVKTCRVPDEHKGFQAAPQQVTANATAIWTESKK